MKVLTKKDTTGWMMNFAWTLEIILCLTGILIAFSLNYIGVSGDSSESLPLSTWLILTMGSLPLFAVAISELFKIPMVTGFLYADSLKVKILAFCGLALICLLTFEFRGPFELLILVTGLSIGQSAPIVKLSQKSGWN